MTKEEIIMRKQPFQMEYGDKVVGYLSASEDGMLMMTLSNFWGTLKANKSSRVGRIVNVDDFVGSVFSANQTAIIPCNDGLKIVFDQSHIRSGLTEIKIYDSTT